MKINNIKKIGKNQYEITLEQNKKIKTYDTIVLRYQLLLKKEIDESLLEQIEEETKTEEVYQKTIQLIARKLRSPKEIEQFLKKEKVAENEINTIIKRLQQQNLLQIDRYIESFIHDRFSFSNDGPEKIKKDLLELKMDPEKVEIEIRKLDELEIEKKLRNLIQKKVQTNHKYSNQYLKQKIMEQMISLGYPSSLIQSILEEFIFDHTFILEQEVKKLYKKYKDKENYDFYIKQKLYQKQFPLEEIERILESIQE